MKGLGRKFSACFGFYTLMLFGVQSAALAADGDACTAITSVPFTTTSRGSYCLTTDISTAMTSGDAIIINNPDVTIDLGGHTLSNLPAGSSTGAIGILAQGPNNITIRNGTLRGFKTAIFLNLSSGDLVEDVRADLNTEFGVVVNGAGSIVRHNQILYTGGTVASGNAIEIGGDGSRVLDNDLVETLPVGNGSTAIGVCFGKGIVAEGNRISNSALPTSGTSYGISTCSVGQDALVVNNRITRMTFGISFDATGKYRDNLTMGVTTPYTGGTNAGNNQ